MDLHNECLAVLFSQRHRINDDEALVLDIVAGGLASGAKLTAREKQRASEIVRRVNKAVARFAAKPPALAKMLDPRTGLPRRRR